jgi:hypothetical protein
MTAGVMSLLSSNAPRRAFIAVMTAGASSSLASAPPVKTSQEFGLSTIVVLTALKDDIRESLNRFKTVFAAA